MRIGHSVHDVPGGYRHSMKDFYYNYYRYSETLSVAVVKILADTVLQAVHNELYVATYFGKS